MEWLMFGIGVLVGIVLMIIFVRLYLTSIYGGDVHVKKDDEEGELYLFLEAKNKEIFEKYNYLIFKVKKVK